MNKMIIAGVAGAILAGGSAMADEPMTLTDGQMDDVTAGFRLALGFGFTGGTFSTAAGLGSGETFESVATASIDTSSIQIVPGTGGGILAQSLLGAETLATSATTYSGLLGGASGSGGTFAFGIIGSN